MLHFFTRVSNLNTQTCHRKSTQNLLQRTERVISSLESYKTVFLISTAPSENSDIVLHPQQQNYSSQTLCFDRDFETKYILYILEISNPMNIPL